MKARSPTHHAAPAIQTAANTPAKTTPRVPTTHTLLFPAQLLAPTGVKADTSWAFWAAGSAAEVFWRRETGVWVADAAWAGRAACEEVTPGCALLAKDEEAEPWMVLPGAVQA